MTPELLESLLYQNESETLDFKRAQYPFEKASHEQQGELLKDILAFANAWRQSDAYILIGVDERKNDKSLIVGVEDHLVNRNLQQFVVSKTNRPVFFSYSSFTSDGREIGELHVPEQDRPVFLPSDFGKLRANVVYIRRSDTTGEASPDEVLRTASSSGTRGRGQPILELEYGNMKDRKRWGRTPTLSVVSVSVPASSRLPDYGLVGGNGFYVPGLSMKNINFYRETATYLREIFFVASVGVAIDNKSTVLAEDVLVSIRISAEAVVVRDRADMPAEPSTDQFTSRVMQRILPTQTSVSRYGEFFEVIVKIGNVQPGTTAWADHPFFLGSRENISGTTIATISANNLRLPKVVETEFSIDVDERTMSASDIRKFAEDFE
jgi:hypothetical protein